MADFRTLRVIVDTDRKIWYAQGLEIDYIAQGTSLEDVVLSFDEGLKATVLLHLNRYDGRLHGLLHPAPTDIWDTLYETDSDGNYRLRVVKSVTREGNRDSFLWSIPFSSVDYYLDPAKG